MAVKRARRARGRPQGGSEEIVRTILETTLKQLDERGFAGISVEDIARVAGVNKTSVYRRWPSKGDLVLAAVKHAHAAEPAFVARGDLRRDLVRFLKAKVATFTSTHGQRIAHALVALEGRDRDDLRQAVREGRDSTPDELIEAAIARGELPPGTDATFLSELLIAPLWNRLVLRHEPTSNGYIGKVVEHVLLGAGYRPLLTKAPRKTAAR